MKKVLVVDDSALMRKHLRDVLEGEGDFTARTARNGVEALAELETFDPDVITLDINMPEMDGITCLSRIMVQRPKPVVMVSSLTEAGAEITLQALSLGAVDVVRKPEGTISLSIDRIHRELILKVRAAASARLRRVTGLKGRLETERARITGRASAGSSPVFAALPAGQFGLVLVGVSTGGPGTLEEILPLLPVDFPWAVLVAQHMPGAFTGVFARRLNDLCPMRVVETDRQMPIQAGTIHIAKGDADLMVLRRAAGLVAATVPASPEHLWHPSVTRLVASALAAVPAERLIGVQLTGMGDDGAEAMAEMARRGGRTIAQDAATSVIFGMPNELIRRGGATVVAPADRVAAQLIAWLAPGAATGPNREDRYATRKIR